MISKIAISLTIGALVTLLSAWLIGGNIYLLNASIAFFSSMAVTLSSMKSYRDMVRTRIELGAIDTSSQRDTIEKIEDPFDLYSDDEERREEEENEDLRSVVAEEKRRLKERKRSLSQSIRDSKAAFNPIRLVSYLILASGFIFLAKSEELRLAPYLLSLSVPTIALLFTLSREGEE